MRAVSPPIANNSNPISSAMASDAEIAVRANAKDIGTRDADRHGRNRDDRRQRQRAVAISSTKATGRRRDSAVSRARR